MYTIGAGTEVLDGEDPGIFLGAGIGLTEALGVSAAWSGDQVNFGASIRLKQLNDMRFSFVLSDAFEFEDRRQITLGLSWSLDLRRRR